MTIFLEIVKHFFKEEISAIQVKSKTDDESLLNTLTTSVASFFPGVSRFSRNPQLSGDKRALAEEFAHVIAQITDAKTDLELKQQIDSQIMKYFATARAMSRAKEARTGNFGDVMNTLTIRLRNIYLTLERTKLIDIQDEDTPLSHFRHFMAGYFVYHMINTEDNPTEKIALSEEKEAAVCKALLKCAENLTTIAKDREDYNALIKERVGDFLLTLREENKKLVKKHGVAVGVPITLSILATVNVHFGTWDRSIGELDVAVIKALLKIDPERCKAVLAEEETLAPTASLTS